MMLLKGVSAREVFQREPELRLSMGTLVFWQKGYGSRPVPEEELEIVRRYIRTQRQITAPALKMNALEESRIEAQWVQPSVPRFQSDNS